MVMIKDNIEGGTIAIIIFLNGVEEESGDVCLFVRKHKLCFSHEENKMYPYMVQIDIFLSDLFLFQLT